MYILFEKKSLINLNMVSCLEIGIDCNPFHCSPAIYAMIGNDKIKLMSYESREKCEFIIDEISKSLLTKAELYVMPETELSFINIDVTTSWRDKLTFKCAPDNIDDFISQFEIYERDDGRRYGISNKLISQYMTITNSNKRYVERELYNFIEALKAGIYVWKFPDKDEFTRKVIY